MKIRVLFFAGLREKTGQSERLLDLPEGSRVADLKDKLALDEVTWRSFAFAVNQAYSPAATTLTEGDEVALIPPVAGG